MAILVGLAAWNMKTVNDLQLEVKGIMVGHVEKEDIQELKRQVERIQWMLAEDAKIK